MGGLEPPPPPPWLRYWVERCVAAREEKMLKTFTATFNYLKNIIQVKLLNMFSTCLLVGEQIQKGESFLDYQFFLAVGMSNQKFTS